MVLLVSTTVITVGFSAFALLIGVIFSYQAYKGFTKIFTMNKRGISVSAEVVEYKSKRKKGSREMTSQYYYAPVYKFKNKNQKETEVQSNLYTPNKKYSQGEKVDIEYYIDDKGQYVINDGYIKRFKNYGFMALMGLAAIIGGIYTLIKYLNQ